MFTPISPGVECFFFPVTVSLGHGVWAGVTTFQVPTWHRVFSLPVLHASHHHEKNMTQLAFFPE